jgi:predicted PurR-regulated permease PerM
MWKWDDKAARIVFWLIFGSLLLVGALVVAPFLGALMWATVLSVLLYPYFKRLTGHGWKPGAAASWVTMIVALGILLPVVGVATIGGLQAYKYIRDMNESGNQTFSFKTVAAEIDKAIAPTIEQLGMEEIHVEELVKENEATLRNSVTGPATQGLQKLVLLMVHMIIAILTMFFMLKDGHRLKEPTLQIVPLPREETEKILIRVQQTMHSVFTGVVFVSLIQAAIGLVTYLCLGIQGAVIWGIATFVMALIPLLGPPTVFVPLALMLFAQGRAKEAIILLVVGFGVISTVDNFLRPFFIGARTSLHPMAIFFSILGGVVFFGPVGLMTGPVVLTLILAFIDIIVAQREHKEIAAPAKV